MSVETALDDIPHRDRRSGARHARSSAGLADRFQPAVPHGSLARALVLSVGGFAIAGAVAAAFWLATEQSILFFGGLAVLFVFVMVWITLDMGSSGEDRRLAALGLSALDALPEPLLITSRSGRILYANPAARAAFHWSGVLPRGVDSLFEPEGPSGAALYRLLQAARAAVEAHEGLKLRAAPDAQVGVSIWPSGTGGGHLLWRILAFDPAAEESAGQVLQGPEILEPSAPPALAHAPPRRASALLPQSEALAATTFDAAPVGMVRVGADGGIRAVNRAFLELADLREPGLAIGRSLLDMFGQKDRAGVAALIAEFRDGRQTGPVEAAFAGNQRVAELHPLRVAALDPDGGGETLIYALDVTDRKQLRQADKMQAIGQLAGGVAHDFNNLLTAIIGFCDLLLLRHGVGDSSFNDINQIRQNATRAANLTSQLLAFSRQQSLVPRVIDLKEVVTDLSQLLRRLLGERIQLTVQHQRDLWLVKVDKVQLEQVIMNLAVNARDAMPGGGSLTIRTENVDSLAAAGLGHPIMPAADYVMISVTDTGIGIAPEDLDKIFEPFFTTKPVGQGTGLGLSTVYGIIKQTDGFIFPESEPGKGTTFRIYLPRHRAEESAAVQPAESVRVQPDLTGQETILLVEDEDAVRTFAARALESRGYRVLSAEGGEAALALLEEAGGPVDLVISDVMMPGMDGPSLVAALRERHPEVRVVFISGYAEGAFRDQLVERGDFEFLPKPFTLKQLAAKVKDVLNAT
ncbi:MAG: response regulator [Alphaproteobacteria bacterium]|nr:response regulator [Alphaproteobacteria bacterium]